MGLRRDWNVSTFAFWDFVGEGEHSVTPHDGVLSCRWLCNGEPEFVAYSRGYCSRYMSISHAAQRHRPISRSILTYGIPVQKWNTTQAR